MRIWNTAIETAARFAADRRGNFAMITALAFPVLAASAGAALDYQQLVANQIALQAGVDSAALAGASSLTSETQAPGSVDDYALKVFYTQMQNSLSDTEMADLKSRTTIEIVKDEKSATKAYDVTVKARYATKLSAFALFLGRDTADVGAMSSSRATLEVSNAMSLHLVLDRSGSMSFVTSTVKSTTNKCANYTSSNWSQYPDLKEAKPCYVNKMGALKTATAALFAELEKIEGNNKNDTVVRVGSVSFMDKVQTAQPIDWGIGPSASYVTAIPDYPTGGTDMTDAMVVAYKALRNDSEKTAHANKGNSNYLKFIVLMTDGENTGASSVWKPALDLETLATCKSARDEGMTIFTVAFMAPLNGQALLKACAGLGNNYFEANDMEGLVKAFAEIGKRAAEKTNRITR